jgi:hypothetical protein
MIEYGEVAPSALLPSFHNRRLACAFGGFLLPAPFPQHQVHPMQIAPTGSASPRAPDPLSMPAIKDYRAGGRSA